MLLQSLHGIANVFDQLLNSDEPSIRFEKRVNVIGRLKVVVETDHIDDIGCQEVLNLN